MRYKSLKQCVDDLDRHGHLVRIEQEVDPHLEMAEIHRRVYQVGGPAIFYAHVKGSPFPAVSNLFGTIDRSRFMLRSTIKWVKRLIEVKAAPPTAILSLLPVVEHTLLFDTAIMGLRDGLTSEGYVLVSVGSPIQLDNLNNKKIGVVDLLGRKPMRVFIEQLLKAQIKLKRVTKVEDLLPLITFESVDALFVSNTMYNQLKSKSNLKLVATPLNVKIGLASAALSDEVIKDRLKECLFAFDKKLNSTLGVDQWRTL